MDTTALQPVLVTGASGFIGGRLVRRLIERHCRVSCLVRANSRIDELRSAGAQLVMGDVTDRGSVERALAESQAGTVFHLAGLVKAQRREDFTSVNAGGVETVASACADRAGPPVLVVVSSLSAAGPCAADPLRVEGDIPAPVSNYGRSKLAGEQAAARYAAAVPISIVRPPIVFGPGDRGVLEMFRPIARWCLHLVPGWGERRFSLIHVDDLVEGLLLAAEKGERLREHGSPGQGVYFIAGEDNPTYAQLGQAIAKALGQKSLAVIRLPGPLLRLVGIGGDVVARVRRHPGWVSRDKITEALAGSWTCSPAKARAQLGWSPAAALADRLHETAQWYRQAGWL
ncbi:MAG: NAD-dependent epimerase/dehydratase family protein [Tepidisphaeraceae bacterium]|jgi:nucleoside-diphosphate-sugar epimerase